VIQVKSRKQWEQTTNTYHNVSRWIKSYFKSCLIQNKEWLIFRIREAVTTFKTDIMGYWAGFIPKTIKIIFRCIESISLFKSLTFDEVTM